MYIGIYLRTYVYLKLTNNFTFYLNPIIDFRGRIYYKSILSPTFNVAVRHQLIINKSILSSKREFDITSSMITLMFSSIEGNYNRLVEMIINKQIDTHSYVLFLVNDELNNINDEHP